MIKEKRKPSIRFPGFEGDWEPQKLESMCTLITKQTGFDYSKTIKPSLVNTRSEDSLPFIQNKDFCGEKINLDTDFYIPENIADRFPKITLDSPSLLISISGKIGNVGYYNLKQKAFIGGAVGICKLKSDNGGFLNYSLESSTGQAYFQSLVKASSHANITIEDIRNIELMMPKTKKEMEKITEFFRSIEILIKLQQQKLNDFKKLKNGLLQKMFPQKGEKIPQVRFPEFTGNWEQRKLKDLTERVTGNDGRMDLPTLTISAANGWMDQRDRFSGNIAGKEQKNYTLLSKGMLSYNHGNSKLAAYGTVFVLEDYEEALVPRVYHSFKTNDLADAKYLEILFASKIPDQELRKLITSGARMDGLLNISYDEFENIKIPIPQIEEQLKISNFFRQVDETITLHQQKLDKLKTIKKSLLQKMFV